MDDLDLVSRKFQLGIESHDRGVVPHFYFAEKNVGQQGPGQVQFARRVRQIVNNGSSDQNGWKWEDRRGFLQFLIRDRSVASTQVADARNHVQAALAGAQ